MPEIDILIPVREPAPWLPETLAGVKALSGGPYRIIVVVNGPNVSTTDMIDQSGLDVILSSSPDSHNLGETLNVGLELCESRFIARLDQDDVPLPHRMIRQREALLGTPTAAMTCSGAILIDEYGSVLGQRIPPTSADALLKVLRWKNIIMHPTVMYRLDVIRELGGYCGDSVFVEDYELWLRVLARHAVIPIAEPLLKYRLHTQQITQAKAISARAAHTVQRARVALAEHRGESQLAARTRHWIWDARQVPRRLLR